MKVIDAMANLPERVAVALSALRRNASDFTVAVSAAANVLFPVTGQRPFTLLRLATALVCSSHSDRLPVASVEISSITSDLASAGTPLPGPQSDGD